MDKTIIKLSSGIDVTVLNVTIDKDRTLRSFQPMFESVVYSELLLNNFQKKYKFDHRTRREYEIAFDYYLQNTTSTLEEIRKDNQIKRFSRTFQPDQFLFLDEFNYEQLKNIPESERKDFIKSLSVAEKKRKYEEIKNNMLKSFLPNENKSTAQLIESAFFEQLPGIKGYTEKFVRDEFSKVLKIGRYFASKPDPNTATYEDYKVSRELLKIDDELDVFYTHDEMQNIIKEIHETVIKIEKFIQNIESIDQNTRIFTMDIYSKEINGIFKKLDKTLKEIKKGYPDNSVIKQLYSEIKIARQSSEEEQWIALLKIKFIFLPQKDQRISLLRKIEKDFIKCFRISSIEILKVLIKEQNLTKPEIRLYIFENIGIKKLNYAIPRFYRPLIYFFKFDDLLFELFIELLIFRKKSFFQFDNYLEMQFRAFLCLYPIIAELTRTTDTVNKSQSRLRKRKSAFDIENSVADEENDNDGNYSFEATDNEIAVDIDLDKNPDLLSFSPEIDQKHNFSDFWKRIEDLCTEYEVEILKCTFVDELSENEIAKNKKVMRQSINRAKNNALNKLKADKFFKDFIDQMN